MKDLTSALRTFASDESGATAIEYALIASIISISIAAAATLLILFSIIMLLTLEWLRGRSERMRRA